MRRLACLLLTLALCLAGTTAMAEEIRAEEKGLDLGNSSLTYPVIAGIEDAELADRVNETVRNACRIPDYLSRISMLISGGQLTVRWTGDVLGDIFSCAVSAEGAVETQRPAYVWTCATVDLTDGREIGADELFTDPAEAEEVIAAYLEDTVEPELSGYQTARELTPMPEKFRLTSRGMILLYETDRFATLHDRAGDVMIGWNALRDQLDLTEGSVARRIGVDRMLELTEDSRAALENMALDGAIPDIPVRLGGSLKEAADTWRLLTDPDLYENGRTFALEGACFRNVLLLTDRLGEGWDDSVIRGIRMDEGCLYGLRVGETNRDEWRAVLGEPDAEAEFDGEKAEAYRTVPGSRDYYRYGERTLQLHCDPEGILRSVVLSE